MDGEKKVMSRDKRSEKRRLRRNPCGHKKSLSFTPLKYYVYSTHIVVSVSRCRVCGGYQKKSEFAEDSDIVIPDIPLQWSNF